MTTHQAQTDTKGTLLFTRVVCLFLLFVVLTGALTLGLLDLGGIFNQMHESGLSLLSEVTQNKYQILQTKMYSWSSLDEMCERIGQSIRRRLDIEQKTYADIAEDAALNAALVMASADVLTEHVRAYDVTGVFLVLDGAGVQGQADTRAGAYIRDADPASPVANDADLQMLRGLPPLTRSLGITLNSFWQATFRFTGDGSEREKFFYEPLNAAKAGIYGAARYCGYWSNSFHMDDNDGTLLFTYSRPLIGADGTVYGVAGVDVSVDYIASLITNGEYGVRSNETAYFLAVTTDGGESYETRAGVGQRFMQHFNLNDILTPETHVDTNGNNYIEMRSKRSGDTFFGCVFPLTLYGANTVFSDQQWVLVGIREENDLFSMELAFRDTIVLLLGILMVSGTLLAVVLARSLSKPISSLVMQLHGADYRSVMRLRPTGIVEVDQLADTVTELNLTLIEEASKISKIIRLTGLPVGAFEERIGSGEVFCSDGFFSLLGCEEDITPNNRISVETFNRIMNERLGNFPDDDDVLRIQTDSGTRYVRMKTMRDSQSVTGTLLDVTDEVEKRSRIEHERDYDVLTNLLNRRAFEHRAGEICRNESVAGPVAAILMMDLDNLKPLNDQYGHDCGDHYIRTFAAALHHLGTERSLIARRSGDEFYILYYGYQHQDEIRDVIRKGWKNILKESCTLPDGGVVKLRASGGIAWYPQDSSELLALIRYADFAMYRSKSTVKGTVEEFKLNDYNDKGYMFNGGRLLDRLLEEKLVRYMLQPIVSAEDGSVMGYEFLMRPQIRELSNPMAVLNLAREEGKLYRVERLTWELALGTAHNLRMEGKLPADVKLFINSVASQLLTPEDEKHIFGQHEVLMSQLVAEITESERDEMNHLQHKLKVLKRFGGELAIDDFGAGYNSDASLLTISAAYLKLDMAFVRDVDLDPNKRALIRNIVRYAKSRGILVIAEGVETKAELDALNALCVDYYQGYYVARPDYLPSVPSAQVVREIKEAAQKYQKVRGGERPRE